MIKPEPNDPFSCRICDAPLAGPILDMAAPSITSVAKVVPVAVKVYLCAECGHLNSPGLPDAHGYFDTEYQFALDSEEHDQIYDIVDGKPRFRTQYQADLVVAALPLNGGDKVLDYGAGKALTLKAVMAIKPGIDGYVFDVSRDYVPNWSAWLPADRQASYELPGHWTESFDVVMSHFAFHCIPDPVRAFRDIARVLKPGGHFFMLVPDVLGNAADMIVAEHVNHFTASSIARGFDIAGMPLQQLDRSAFRGGFLAVGRRNDTCSALDTSSGRASEDAGALALANFWTRAEAKLDNAAAAHSGKTAAIYGAGVYGTFIASRLGKRVALRCFIDRNPHLAGTQHMGLPVVAASEFPRDVNLVFAGLNPLMASAVMDRFKADVNRPELTVVLMDGMPDVSRQKC